MNRKGRLLLIGGCVALLVVGSGAAWWVKSRQLRTPAQFYAQGYQRMQAGEYLLALNYIRQAATLEPANTNYLYATATAAALSGSRPDAVAYARRAWEQGLRTPAVARFVMENLDPADPARALEQSLVYIRALPQGMDRLVLEADALAKFGKPADALKLLVEANKRQSSPELVHQIARLELANDRPAEAQSVLVDAMNRRQLDDEGFGLLAMVMTQTGTDPKQALAVFEQARQQGKFTERLRLDQAVTHLMLMQDKEALAVLEQVRPAATIANAASIRQQARLLEGYLMLAQKDQAGLERLAAEARALPAGREKEGEGYYFAALTAMASGKSGSDNLGKAAQLLPNHPAVVVLQADALLRAGRNAQAVATLEQLRGPINRWPPLLLTRARAYAATGRTSEAAVLVSEMHKRGLFTRDSVALFRDLAIQLGNPGAGQEAQRLLENRYPDDPDVRAFRGFVQLGSGDANAAARTFEELIKKYPEQDRFKLAKVQTFLAATNYAGALQELDRLKVDDAAAAPIRALAYTQLGDLEKALAAYETALRGKAPVSLRVGYGKVLGLSGRAGEATNQWHLALKEDPSLLEARIGLLAAAYASGDIRTARDQARLILANPQAQSPRVLLMIAQGELDAGQPSEAINLSSRALTADPRSIQARAIRAEAFARTGRLPEAVGDLLEALKADPQSVPLRQQLALYRLQAGQLNEALTLANQLAAASPTNLSALSLQFEILARLKRFSEAAASLQRLLPKLPPAQQAIARSWLAEIQGDTNAALAFLEPVRDDPAALFKWAQLRIEAKGDASVLDALRGKKVSAAQWAALGLSADQRSLGVLALNCYAEALKLEPENPGVLNNWAWRSFLNGQGNAPGVLDAARKAAQLLPRDANILDTHSEILLFNRRFLECSSLLDANGPLVNDSPQLLLSLARAQEGAGNAAAALQSYRRAAELSSRKNPWPVRMPKAELEAKIGQLTARK